MNIEKLVSKYIASAEHVLGSIQLVEGPLKMSAEEIKKTIEYARAYLDDAKYYRKVQKLDVGLASIVYCEGVLDALKLLGAVKFEWPTNPEKEK